MLRAEPVCQLNYNLRRVRSDVLLGMSTPPYGPPGGSQDVGFICLLTGVSSAVTVETRQCYQVGSEDSQHINDILRGRAVKLSLMHARLPGSDGPIIHKVLIFTQEVMGGKGMKSVACGRWGPNPIKNI